MRLALSLALALAAAASPARASVLASPATPSTAAQSPATSLMAQAPRPHGGTDGSGPVPEPSTLLLVGSGLLGVAITARLRRRRKQPG